MKTYPAIQQCANYLIIMGFCYRK